jgi:cytochrome c
MRWTILATFVAGIAAWGWLNAAPMRLVTPAAAAKATQEEWMGLPPGKGRDEVFNICGACHSLRMVTQQGLSRSSWVDVLAYMNEEQEMDKLDPDDEKLILDYLAKWYGPDRKARALKR